MNEIDDDEIAIRLLDGDKAAQWQLLVKYGQLALGALAKEFPGIAEEDRDLVLEQSLDKAIRSGHTYDESKGPIGSWFIRIVLNITIDLLRTGKIGFKQDSRTELDALVERARTNEADYCNDSELRTDMLDAIEQLTDAQKRVALADLLDGSGCADTNELAKQLGVGRSAIRVNRMRYRASLKEILRKKGYTGQERKVPR